MFRKTSKFPARPVPPSIEKIHEDIKNASEKDVVFTYLRKLNNTLPEGDSFLSESSRSLDAFAEEEEEDVELQKKFKIESMYSKVHRFLEVNKSFNTSVEELEELKQQLNRLKEDILKSSEELKQFVQSEPKS